MSYLLLRKDFNCDYDNAITCPICNNNQMIYQSSDFDGEKITTKFKCISCQEKEYDLIMKTNKEKNTTEIFWEFSDGGFYKIYFD